MQDNTLITVFTGILAVAFLLQTLLFFGIYRSLRHLSVWLSAWSKDMLRSTEAISAKVEEGVAAIKNTAESLEPITKNLVHASQVVNDRVVELDQFVGETMRTVRLEFMHIQDTFQLAMRRAEQAIEILRDSVLAPINEATAIARAVRMGLDVLFRRRKNISFSSQDDDEMFI